MQEVSYGKRLSEIAAERGDDVDLIIVRRDGTEQGVPWRELETRANQIARAFEERSVEKDAIVAIALPNGVEHIFSTLAIWKLGATLLPPSPRSPAVGDGSHAHDGEAGSDGQRRP